MHKCIKCAKTFEDDDVPLFNGCECGSKFFVSVKPGQEAEVETLIGASDEELDTLKSQTDLEILKVDKKLPAAETPTKTTPTQKQHPAMVSTKADFGIETVRMSKPGIYDINIEALLRGKPVVIFSNGKTYIIHLATVFKEVMTKIAD